MSATAANTRLDEQHPWPGLRSFAEADSPYFFGRETESRALQDLVERAPVVVLYGQSGLGKTSLLRAGLFPALKNAAYLPVWVRLDWTAQSASPTRQILVALSTAFKQAGVEAPAPAADDSLWSYFHRADADFWGPRNRLVTPIIVLDQFEEIFTLGRRDASAAASAEALVRDMEAQFEQRPPAAVRERLERHPEEGAVFDMARDNVRFVVSLREDYLPHLDAWRDRLPSMLARRYRLEPMSRQQALQVVQRAGSALVSETVAEDIVAFVATGGADPRVEPAILSVVCDELNLRRVRARLPQITRELLSGERSRIIEDFYERSFEGISEGTRDWVEDELLTASGHRDRAALEDGRKAGIDTAELERLVERRVLHSDERNQVQWVEFTHDLLTAPALASRTVRQRRQAEALAQQREDEVRGKLRRSRIVSAVFGVMALVMAAGAWWLQSALAEAKGQRATAAAALEQAEAQTSLALREKARADEEATRARQREQEAARAAEGERRAANDAEAALARAVDAEGEARSNLTRAQQTALATAQQAVVKLKEQWVNPSFDSASVVQNNISNVEPLIASFGDLPAMRIAQRQMLALGALIYFERTEEAQCTRLAGLSQAVAVPRIQRSVAAMEADAASLLATGSCLQLRARYSEAGQMLQQATSKASELPATSPERLRLTVSASLGKARSDMSRFDHEGARVALRAAESELDSSPAGALSAEELTSLRVLTASLESSLAATRQDELLALGKATQLLRSIPAKLRDSIYWRSRQLALDLDRAWALHNSGQQADADDLARRVLAGVDGLLEVDTSHVTRQSMRFRALRLRAEIQHSWRRKQASLAILDQCRQASDALAVQEPGLPLGMYYRVTVSWLMATRSDRPAAEKRPQLMDALGLLDRLVQEAPDYAAAKRSVAILHRALAALDEEEGRDTKRPGAERSALKDSARQRYAAAQQALAGLAHAARHPEVADTASSSEISLGDLELERSPSDPSAALAAFKRAELWHRGVPVTEKNHADRMHDGVFIQQRIARSLRWQGKFAEADVVDNESLAQLEVLRRQFPERFALTDLQAWTHRMAAEDQLRAGDLKAAVTSQVAAAELLFVALKLNPLSKPAEESLSEAIKFAREKLLPTVSKSDDTALRAQLSTINSYQPGRVVEVRNAERLRSPLLPGDWEHYHGDRMPIAELGINAEARKLRTAGWTIVGARRLALRFYEDSALVELDLRKARGETAAAAYVVQKGREPVQLTGSSTVLENLNQAQNLDLSSSIQAGQYLRFHFWAMRYDLGRVRPVEQINDLMWHPEAAAATRSLVEARIEPFEMQRGSEGDWTGQGTVQYGAKLSQLKATLSRNGNVAFPRINNVGDRDLPLVTETYRNGLRLLDDTVTKPALLLQHAQQASNRRDWKTAANHQEELVTFRLKNSSQSEQKDLLPGLYLSLAWFQLLNKEPDKALKASDAGLALQDKSLALQTNRAHALLLLGREKEALDLYRENIGKTIATTPPKRWQVQILDDLKRFDDYGLKDPRFAAVRQLMEAAKP